MKKLIVSLSSLLLFVCAQTAYAITIDSPTDGAGVESPITLTGTATPDASISIKQNNNVVGTTTANEDGDWSFVVNSVSPGPYEYTATETYETHYAYMNPSSDGRIDVLDTSTHEFVDDFFLPDDAYVHDLQVAGDTLYVMGTIASANTCQVYTYSAETYQPIGNPIDIASTCVGINFDVSSDGRYLSAYYYDTINYDSHIAILDLEENNDILDVIVSDLDYGYVINTGIAPNGDLYIHNETGIEKYLYSAGAYSLDTSDEYAVAAASTMMLTPDNTHLVFGDYEGNIVERSAVTISSVNEYFIDENFDARTVAVSPDSQHYYTAGYNTDHFEIWEWDLTIPDAYLVAEYNQTPESLGITPDNTQWVVGDNHSYGYVYMGRVGETGIDHTLQIDNSSYRMSTDDFFSPGTQVTESTTITVHIPVSDYAAPRSWYGTGSGGGNADTTVAPGQKITVSGSGYKPESDVTLTLFSSPVQLATVKVSAQGTFSTQVTIPRNTSLGRHSIEISGVGPNDVASTIVLGLTVSYLPATGNNTYEHFIFAVYIVGAGALLLVYLWAMPRKRLVLVKK